MSDLDDAWDRARHEAEGQGPDPAEMLRLMAREREARAILVGALEFVDHGGPWADRGASDRGEKLAAWIKVFLRRGEQEGADHAR